MRGKVLIYNDEKKFGFVKGQDGKKYFFHLEDWIIKEEPRKGFIIEFETKETAKGPKAIGIKEVFANNDKPISSQNPLRFRKVTSCPKILWFQKQMSPNLES